MHFNDLTSRNTDLYNAACDLDSRLVRVVNELVGPPPSPELQGVGANAQTENFLYRTGDQQDRLTSVFSFISNSLNWLEANVLDMSTMANAPAPKAARY